MEVGHQLEIQCEQCGQPIAFSVLNTKALAKSISCPDCGQSYQFEDETLIRQLKLFEALCQQIHASEEILGHTAIAMDVGSHHIKVPFNLLLTRLSSVLNLKINGKHKEIHFRIDTTKDVASV